MQFLQNITVLLSLIELATVKQQFFEIISDICEATTNEQQIYTIIYFNDRNVANGAAGREQLDLFKEIHQRNRRNPVAVMNVDSNNTHITQYALQFNRNLVSIVELSEDTNQNEQILDKLWQRLHRNMQSTLILLFDDTANATHVNRILSSCVGKHAINVIALQPKLAVSDHSYWAVQLFSKQQTIRRNFSPHYRNIFRDQMENMHGYPLRIVDKGWYPQIYNFTPKHGPTTLSGYLGRALTEYAYRRNATLTSPYPPSSKVYFLKELSEILLNKSAITGPLWPLHVLEDRLSFSNALQMFDMCLMIPLEKPIPKNTFYYNIFHKTPVILFFASQLLITCILILLSRWRDHQRPLGFNDFCNISVLEGLLGMPFRMTQRSTFIHRLIYIIIWFRALNIDVAYNAYLQSFNCGAPIEPLSKTIDDVIKRGIKVTMDATHLQNFRKENNIRVNLHKFTLFSNSTELLTLRDSLDTRFAFYAHDMWFVYKEQQKYFSRPLFRLTDICSRKSSPLALPFHTNSMYRESLTDFMGRLLAAGLIKFWAHNSFFELVSMKKVLLEDRNKQELFKPMKLEDLQDVIIVMSILFTASFCCFLLELFWQKLEKLFNSMVRINRSITSRPIFLR